MANVIGSETHPQCSQFAFAPLLQGLDGTTQEASAGWFPAMSRLASGSCPGVYLLLFPCQCPAMWTSEGFPTRCGVGFFLDITARFSYTCLESYRAAHDRWKLKKTRASVQKIAFYDVHKRKKHIILSSY